VIPMGEIILQLPEIAEKHIRDGKVLQHIDAQMHFKVADYRAQYLRTAQFDEKVKPELHFKK
jgi:hypothetical protein